MKKHTLLLLLAATLLSAACTNQANSIAKKGSSGKTLEVMIVADADIYYGEVKALVDSIFRSPIFTLPKPEPRYSQVNIPRKSLDGSQMFQMHRNIVVLSIDSSNADKTFRRTDPYASPQMLIELEATSRASLCHMLRQHEQEIQSTIIANEHERIQRAFYNTRNVDLINLVRKKFGFGFTFSEGFTMARSEDGFAWIRKETKDFGQSLLVDVQPYRAQTQFDSTAILNHLDTLMRRYVPGPTEGSYMGIERRVDRGASIESRLVSFPKSDYAVEMRSWWRTYGDFMGGPLVCYTLLSPDHRQVLTLVGFVYCPRNDRYSPRDLLMQTESIAYSLQWE